MKKYLLVLLAAVVIISGCTGGDRPVTTDPNRGLTINSFNADPASVRSGELVLFDIEVENIGGTTAKEAQIDLYGVENQWRDSTGNPIPDTLTKELGTLKPPDVGRGVPGQFKLVQYRLMTPDVPQGIPYAATVTARVTYDYATNGIIDIPALSENEITIRESNNQALPSPTFSGSAGPIKILVDSAKGFLPIHVDTADTESDDQEWPLRIIFSNGGDGFPITLEDDPAIRGTGGKISGKITLLGAGNPHFDECLGVTSGNEIDLDSTDILVRLRQDGTYTIGCMIGIDKSAWGSRPEDRVQLVFELFYRYYVDATATVSVQGK